jgi:retinol dehydrogenase 12
MAMTSASTLVICPAMVHPQNMNDTMTGKTVVVTGATSGIGFHAAKAMAQQGARVFITARDQAKGDDAVAKLKLVGNDRIELLMVDFASMASIRSAAAELRQRTDHIHVLLNNAGAVYLDKALSKDGLELTFATNHIGYFLFTQLLLDVVKASAPARIVSVSSDAHRTSSGVKFDDLERKNGYNGGLVYGETKLMNILFTRSLSRRLEGTGVTANCLHPGVVATGFAHNNKGVIGFIARTFGKYFLITAEQGAATSIYLCTSPEVEDVSGKYFAKCKEAKPRPPGVDDVVAERLWAVSEQVVGSSS